MERFTEEERKEFEQRHPTISRASVYSIQEMKEIFKEFCDPTGDQIKRDLRGTIASVAYGIELMESIAKNKACIQQNWIDFEEIVDSFIDKAKDVLSFLEQHLETPSDSQQITSIKGHWFRLKCRSHEKGAKILGEKLLEVGFIMDFKNFISHFSRNGKIEGPIVWTVNPKSLLYLFYQMNDRKLLAIADFENLIERIKMHFVDSKGKKFKSSSLRTSWNTLKSEMKSELVAIEEETLHGSNDVEGFKTNIINRKKIDNLLKSIEV